MGLPEIIGIVTGCAGLLIALVTAISTVKSREFEILRDTVGTLDTECKRLRADLRAAEQKIAELEAENSDLRGRVSELEAENLDLRRKLRRSPAG